MRMLILAALLAFAVTPAQATPSDDIRSYCASVHQSYQYRLICEREEHAAKARLYRLEGMPYGIPPEIWAYCGRVQSAWQYMEICTKQELRAKGLLGVP